MKCFHQYPSPVEVQRSMRKRGWKDLKSQRWLKGNNVFQTHQDWCMCALPESVTAHTRSYKFKSGKKNPNPEKWKWTESLTLTKKPFSIASFWERENRFSSVECCWVYQPHTKEDPTLRSSWPTWNIHHVFVHLLFYFVGFLFHLVFLFVCFDLHSLLC